MWFDCWKNIKGMSPMGKIIIIILFSLLFYSTIFQLVDIVPWFSYKCQISDSYSSGETSLNEYSIPSFPPLTKSSSSSKPHNSPILLYRAYYDNRTSTGRVRILGVSKCIEGGGGMEFAFPFDSSFRPLRVTPVEGYCPWEWAPKCKWNAFSFESEEVKENPKEVMIRIGENRTEKMEVNDVPQLIEDSLQVCVPPLYWYDDWPRLVVFIELWKTQNVSSILIYLNSASQTVMKILEKYEEEGIVKMIHWPLLPTLSSEDPNRSTYRLSHSLAHNDCVLRLSSQFAALVDIDEFLFVRNRTVLDLVKGLLKKNPKAGSFDFEHRGLKTEPVLDESFNGLHNVSVHSVDGPKKTVFMPSRTRFLSTHKVWVHVKNYTNSRVPPSMGILLHNRVTFGNKKERRRVDLGPSFPFTQDFILRVNSSSFSSLGNKLPQFTSKVSVAMTQCMSTWRGDGCKVPMSRCYHSIFPLEQWTFLPPSNNSFYSIL